MIHNTLIFIFYIFSYLTFSPIGAYALWKNRFKNKILWNITFTLFLFKIIFDFLLYKDVLLIDKEGIVIAIFIIVFNFIFYMLIFGKVSSNEVSDKKEKNDSIIKTEEISDKKDIEKVSSTETKIDEAAKETSNKKRKPKTMLEEVSQYLNTGEIFTFYYKGLNDSEYKIRNIIVNEISNNYSATYVEGIDIDINAPRTFRVDRMLSLTHELDKLSDQDIENLKTFYASQEKIIEIIEKINSAIPTKFFDIPEEIDINEILSNGGFIKKNGKNCQIFNNSFEYLGSKLWSIATLKKKIPYILVPKNKPFVDSNYCSYFDFYTLSSDLIEKLNDYDEEKFKKAENLLKIYKLNN